MTTPETATNSPKNIQGDFRDPITEVNRVIDEIEAQVASKTYKNYVCSAHLRGYDDYPAEWRVLPWLRP